MQIGLVIYEDLHSRSGGYLYDRQLVREIERLGEKVEVISIPKRSYPRQLLDNFSREIMALLTEKPFDVLLQDELNHPSLFLINRRLKRLKPTLLVGIVHHLRSNEVSWFKNFYRLVERRYLKTLDGVIYNSPTTKKSVETLVELPGVVALPGGDHLLPGITETIIHRRTHKPGPLNITFIGNIIPRKGLDTLLHGLARLPQENFRLYVAGDKTTDARYSQKMVHLARVSGIERNTKFLGYCSESELHSLLRDSHLLVVPSQYEGFGIVYLEAMGFGLPPVASAAGGAGDLIQDKKNGFLLEPGDTQGLASILQILYEDRVLLASLSGAALRTYKEHPTWSDCSNAVLNFLNEQQSDPASRITHKI
jgi:glycosyltransferase involved in cell wall biosynthesis